MASIFEYISNRKNPESLHEINPGVSPRCTFNNRHGSTGEDAEERSHGAGCTVNNRHGSTPPCNTKIIVLFSFLLMAGILTACKISYSFSGARISPLASQFTVDYFQNRASIVQPTLSQDITDALTDMVKTQTSLKYSTEDGDVAFSGEITDYSSKPLTASADNQAATNRFTITLRVKFENFVEPELSYEETFSRYEDYSSNLDFSSVEAELSESIVKLLIEDIFNKAFVTW